MIDLTTARTASAAPPAAVLQPAPAATERDAGEPRDAPAREHEVVIELGHLRPALLRAARLFAETVVVPTALLFLLLHTVGLVAGLSAVMAWCALTVTVRWATGRRLPGTLLLCVSMLVGRAALALALSSALVYLVQPIIGSLLMALLFLGSAAVGKPLTIRLAHDFVHLPAHLFHRHGARRVFTQVAVVFGVSRLIDAGMSLGLLHFGLDAGLLSRGVLSGALTVLTIVVCAGWGTRALRRIPGVTLRLRPAPAA
jgi:hypothetical protein